MHTPLLHNYEAELHNAELRVTPARLGVLEVLEQSDIPLDVSSVILYLSKRNVSADAVTVFRILNAFTKKGIAKPIQFNEGKKRYEYAAKPSHHHFVCEKCGNVADVNACNVDELERHIERTQGVKVARHALEFFGLCRRCRS